MTMDSDPTPHSAEGLTIEQVGLPDLERIIDFLQPVYADTYPNAQRRITAKMFEEEAFRLHLGGYLQEKRLNNPSAFLLAACKEDKIVGTLGLQFDEDNPSTAEIWGFYVDPSLQGQGVGGKLWQNLMTHERTKGVKKYCLIVAEDSETARVIYEAKRFEYVGWEERPWPSWIAKPRNYRWLHMEKSTNVEAES